MPFQNVFGPMRVACECGLVFQRHGFTFPMPLRKVHVEAEVVDFVSEVTITQEYINCSADLLEAYYFFPIEESAAVIEFEAELDGRIVKGIVKEKEEAKQDYHKAIQQGQSAFLLEETKPDIFKVLVGNLPPGSLAKIKIKLIGELPVEEAAVKFVLPTTIAPRYIPPSDNTDEAKEIAKIPYSEWSKPVPLSIKVNTKTTSKIKKLSSPSHNMKSTIDAKVGESGHFHGQAMLDAASSQMDRDFILRVDLEEPFVPRVYIEKSRTFGSTAAMFSFTPSFKLDDQKVELIFLIDRSGSMGGDSIEQAKKALVLFLHSLPADCYFNIVSFGSSWTSLHKRSVRNSDESLTKAVKHAKSMDADYGGTEILQPLQGILNWKPVPSYLRQLFVLTDGQVSNTEEVLSLVRQHSDRTRVFSLGIGRQASRHLVKGIARNGGGTAQFAIEDKDLKSKVLSQLRDAIQPAVSEIDVKWGGMDEDCQSSGEEDVVTEKTLLGYRKKKVSKKTEPKQKLLKAPYKVPPVFDGNRLLVFALFEDDKLPLDVTLTASSPDGPLSVNLPLVAENVLDGEFIHQMAARKMIQDLEEGSSKLHKNDSYLEEDIKKEIIRLSIKFSLASKYASFIGVDSKRNLVKGFYAFDLHEIEPDVYIGNFGRPRGGGGMNHMSRIALCASVGAPVALQQMQSSSMLFGAAAPPASPSLENFALHKSKKRSSRRIATSYDNAFDDEEDFAIDTERCSRRIATSYDNASDDEEDFAIETDMFDSAYLSPSDNKESEIDEDDLSKLISCQSFNGEFKLDKYSRDLAGKSEDQLKEVFTKLKVSESAADTVLALALMKVKFSELETTWDLIYNKSLKWLIQSKFEKQEIESIIESVITFLKK